MTSLYHLSTILILIVVGIGLLSIRILQKYLIRCLISFAFLGGILLSIGLTTTSVSKAYSEELAVKKLKFVQAQKKEDCDSKDKGCNDEK